MGLEMLLVAANMTQSILDQSIIGGVVDFYIASIGAASFFGVLTLGVTILMYIWTQSLEFVATIWILIGGALEIYIPGPALTIGKVLMILGIFLILIKILLGRTAYG